MAININLRVTSFGQLIIDMSKPTLAPGEPHVALVKEEVRYHAPKQTSPLVYELRYEEEAKNYIVPPATG